MSDGINFDLSEVTKLAADIGEAPKNAGPNIRSAFDVTSIRVKKDAASEVSKSPSWKAAASAINYDIKTDGHTIESEIGYEKGGAGNLGNLREFGAPDKQLGPHNDFANALERNQGDFQTGLEKAIDDSLKKAGL